MFAFDLLSGNPLLLEGLNFEASRLMGSYTFVEQTSALRLLTLAVTPDGIAVRPATRTSTANSRVYGISTQSVEAGESGDVLIFGLLRNSGFNFQAGDNLFLGIDGMIETEGSLTEGEYLTRIGDALDEDLILFNPQRPLINS